MRMIKQITDNLPEEHKIQIWSEYKWDEIKGTYVVEIKGALLKGFYTIKSYEQKVLKPKKILFKKQITWKQACENGIEECIGHFHDYLYVTQKDEEINRGLFDSLDKL